MEKTDKLHKILKKVNLFSSLDSESLSILGNKIRIIPYKQGDYICKEGEPADRMYIILSGNVRVLKKGKGKSQIEITKLKSGSVVGIMSLFEKKNRSATRLDLGIHWSHRFDKKRRSLVDSSRQIRPTPRCVDRAS